MIVPTSDAVRWTRRPTRSTAAAVDAARRPAPSTAWSTPPTPSARLTRTLDLLRLDHHRLRPTTLSVGGAATTAVVQLKLGQPISGGGRRDHALDAYLGIDGRADVGGACDARRAGSAPRPRAGPSPCCASATARGSCSSWARPTVTRRAASACCCGPARFAVARGRHAVGDPHDEPRRRRARHPLPGRRRRPQPPGAGRVEQQAVHDFALAVRPVLTVWIHENYGWVGGSGASMAPARQYQALTLGHVEAQRRLRRGLHVVPDRRRLGQQLDPGRAARRPHARHRPSPRPGPAGRSGGRRAVRPITRDLIRTHGAAAGPATASPGPLGPDRDGGGVQ